jgi:subtilase-type serine protease
MIVLTTAPAAAEQWHLEKVNADAAHRMGHTGAGVLVGVIDTGIASGHRAFTGRIDSRSRNFLEGPSDEIADTRQGGHGTGVAGLIAAARGKDPLYGIAYDSKILALRAFAKDGNAPQEALPMTALRYAIEAGAKVVNGSFAMETFPGEIIADQHGTLFINPKFQQLPFHPYGADKHTGLFAPADVQAIRVAAAADVLVVFAAGNDAWRQPDAAINPRGYALLPYMRPENHNKGVYTLLDDASDLHDPSTYRLVDPSDPRLSRLDYSDLQGSIIAVAATDKNDRIATYSTRCGVTWQWCLAAPGGDIDEDAEDEISFEAGMLLALAPEDGQRRFFGTSAATPLVSGAAAVVRGAFPYLTAKQTAELLLTTTNTTGHLADRAIYGRGMLDLGRAVLGPREFGAEGFARIFDVDTQGYDSTWSGDIHGAGGLAKRGLGTLTLTGKNIYSGPTTVAGGTLVVNGTNAGSAVVVERQGRLSGTGTVGPTRVAGTIAPGSAASALTVSGAYQQEPTAVYEADITPGQESGRLVVRGPAHLQGGQLQLIGVRPSMLNNQYTLIQAAEGISGDFASKPDEYLFIDLSARKTANEYSIVVSRNPGGFGVAAETANQRATAHGLDGLAPGDPLFDTLLMEQDMARARSALDQLSGELYPGVLGTLTNQAAITRLALLDRLGQASGHSTPRASSRAPSLLSAQTPPNLAPHLSSQPPSQSPPRLSSAWGHYLGTRNHAAGNGNVAASSSSYSGVLFGTDTAAGPSTRLGMALGMGKSNVKIDARHSRAGVDNYTVAAYGATQMGGARLKYGSSYGWHRIVGRRDVVFANAGQTNAKYDARTLQLFWELSTVRSAGSVDLEPYAGLAYVNTHAGHFKESGAAGLRGAASSQQTTLSSLGLRARTQWDLARRGELSLEGGLGWRHAFGRVAPTTRMQFGNAQAFTVEGAPITRDALLLNAGLAWNFSSRASVGVSYASQLGNGVTDQSVQARAAWRF